MSRRSIRRRQKAAAQRAERRRSGRPTPRMTDGMVAFGAMCTWWDSKDQTASTSKGLPVCPHCRKPLYEETESVFLDGADGHEQDLVDDYKAFILWLRGRPCHTSFADAAKEFIAEAKTKALAEALAAETP